MRNILLYITISVVVLIDIKLLLKLHQANQSFRLVNIATQKIQLTKNANEKVSERIVQTLLDDYSIANRSIDANFPLYDINNKMLPFKSIVKDKKVLFFLVFFRTNCESCVNIQLIKLIELSRTVGQSNIILLTDHRLSDITWIKNKYDFNFRIYNIKKPFIKINNRQLTRLPILFACKNNLEIYKPFLLEQELINESDLFFKEAKDLFYSETHL